MTDDLSTLLRDAGREPTIDLDVDAVHARGRRRAVGRNVAIGAGALAVLGVLGVGVLNLMEAPEAPIVDQAPGETGPEDAAPPTDAGDGTLTDAADVATTYGVTVHELGFDQDRFTGFGVTVTTPDGVETGQWTEDATQLGQPVVADDGGAWALTPDGRTVRRDPVTGDVETIQSTGLDTGWLPIGPYADGLGSVLVVEVGMGDTTVAGPSSVHVATADGVVPFQPFPALYVDALDGEPVGAAAAVAEELVVLTGSDVGRRAVLLPSGREGVELLSVGGLDMFLTDVAISGREAWVAGGTDAGAPVLRRIDLDTLEVVSVPIPSGVRAIDRLSAAPDAPLVALGVRGDDDTPATIILDAEGVRAGSGDGVVAVLDTEAIVHLLPWDGSTSGSLATCATGEDVRFNAPPAGSGGEVWWLCQDAAGQLADEFAYPFVAVELFSGGDGTMPEGGPGALVEAWADGPPADVAALGLSGGLDPEVATIADVTLDGSTAIVDLAPGPQVGVLGATYASGALIHGVVGAALQYDELDAVRFTLDGSCEAFSGLIEGDDCTDYDRSWAPWNQGRDGDVLSTDLEDGRHAVFLHGFDTGQPMLTVDVVQWLTGDEADAAYAAETGDTSGVPNGYWIVNENDQLRTLAVAPDVDVQTVWGDGDVELDPSSWRDLPDYLAGFVLSDDTPGLSPNPWWITLDGGVITAIEEQYVP